jgi:hypothetical protein
VTDSSIVGVITGGNLRHARFHAVSPVSRRHTRS